MIERVRGFVPVKSACAPEGDTASLVVALDGDQRVAADEIVARLDGLHWRGAQVAASVLLSQDNTEPAA